MSVYEFIDGDVSCVMGNYHLDSATHRRKSAFKHPTGDVHIAVRSE